MSRLPDKGSEIKGRLKSFLSKKLIALAIATVLVFMGKLDGEYWFWLAVGYTGLNVLSKTAEVFKKKGE